MKYYLLFLLWFSLGACHQSIIPAKSSKIAYRGRINLVEEVGAEMYWSGSAIRVNFDGGDIEAVFEDERGESMYNVLLDKKLVKVLSLQKGKNTYPLVSQVPQGKHQLELFRRNEYDRGKTTFIQFNLSEKTSLFKKEQAPTRKIEFFGNSITAGYAIEDTTGKDNPAGYFTNHYLTYANLTAQHFNAIHHCTCKSGIGVTISWFPEIMPDIYDRTNPLDSTSQWDFSQFTPEVVVVNLFQNDSWLVNQPDYYTFKQRFPHGKPSGEWMTNAYQSFIANLRSKYLQAHIICMLGTMDIVKEENSIWKGYVEQALKTLNDSKIYPLFLPFCEHGGHPNLQDNQKTAEKLIQLIEDKVGWK
jgi:hypothetical protein